MEHTREGPDVFSGPSLSDRAGVDGGGHGAEGEGREEQGRDGATAL